MTPRVSEAANVPILSAVPVASTRRWGQLALLALALSAANYSRTALGPLQEQIRVALGLSDNQIALLQGPAMALPLLICAVPLGILVDRYARNRLLWIFALCSTAGGVLTAAAASFAMLVAARCIAGLAAYATSIVVFSLLADLYSAENRGRATMVVTIGEVAGASAAFAFGGALLTLPGPSHHSWQVALLCLTAPLLPVTLTLLRMREPERTGVVVSRPSARQTCVELWRYRASFAPLLAGKVMVGTAYGAVLIWAAPALSRSFNLSPERVGSILATTLLIGGLSGPVLGGFLADVCQRTGGPARTMLALTGLGLLAALSGCFAILPGPAEASALLIAFMTTVAVTGVTEMTLTTVIVPNELRGLCLSVLVATGLIVGVGAAPLTVSLLSGFIGGPVTIGKALCIVCVLTGVLGSITFALAGRYAQSAR